MAAEELAKLNDTTEIMQLFLDAGGDVNSISERGGWGRDNFSTPYDELLFECNRHMTHAQIASDWRVRFLQERGAKTSKTLLESPTSFIEVIKKQPS